MLTVPSTFVRHFFSEKELSAEALTPGLVTAMSAIYIKTNKKINKTIDKNSNTLILVVTMRKNWPLPPERHVPA
ncbi:MAG: hypothetical protein KDD06_04235, partial [Phaeodactylibacter sp.]|nr:hypothetical protein [Phaeodactylibacter sp.]